MNAKEFLERTSEIIDEWYGGYAEPRKEIMDWIEQYANHKTEELKKELEEEKRISTAQVRINNEIAEERNELQKEVERWKNVKKEFNDWLNNEKNGRTRMRKLYSEKLYENQQLKQVNKELVDFKTEVLQLFKSGFTSQLGDFLTKHKTETR